jgi:uncharacterized lipoprotein
MMRLVVLILFAGFVALVAACGVDGEPEQPEPKPAKTGITVTGSAAVGVSF